MGKFWGMGPGLNSKGIFDFTRNRLISRNSLRVPPPKQSMRASAPTLGIVSLFSSALLWVWNILLWVLLWAFMVMGTLSCAYWFLSSFEKYLFNLLPISLSSCYQFVGVPGTFWIQALGRIHMMNIYLLDLPFHLLSCIFQGTKDFNFDKIQLNLYFLSWFMIFVSQILSCVFFYKYYLQGLGCILS